MRFNATLFKSVLSIYDEMQSTGISLVYFGEFSQAITTLFTSMSENEMARNGEDRKVMRKVYHTMVETLQNLNKHSDEYSDNSKIGKGMYMIGKSADSYFIISSNKIRNQRIAKIAQTLNDINKKSKAELDQLHKEQLRYGYLSSKGGAGLGFIDIVRKTGQPLDFYFFPVNNDTSLFVMRIELNPTKIIRNKKSKASDAQQE